MERIVVPGTLKGPVVVIVTGPPCGGKTTLSRRLAPALNLPLVCKDDFKELLADRSTNSRRSREYEVHWFDGLYRSG